MKNTITATDLKNKTAEILNESYFRGKTILIGRYGKPIAKITPIKEKSKDMMFLKKILKKTFGTLPDFPQVTKYRKSRSTTFKL